MPVPKKNVAYTFNATLFKQSDPKSIQTSPTLAAGDWKHSGDDSALANLGTLPAESPAGSGILKIVLSQAEMNYDRVNIRGIDAAGAEWCDVLITIDTTAVTVDDLVRSTTPANALTVEADGMGHADCKEWLGGTIATPTVTGVPEVDVTHWIGTAAATPTTAGVPEVDITHIGGAALSTTTAQLGVNVVQISTDATAADNLEAILDGTGGTGLTLSTLTTSGTVTLNALTVSNATTLTGAVSATHASNDIRGVKPATGGIVAASFAAGAIDAAALAADAANEIADALLDRTDGIETGLTLRQFCRLVGATTGGKLSGAGSGTEVFRNAVADSANRVTATVDSSGNRTAISYSL